MRMQVKTWFGTFALEGGRIIQAEIFERDIDSIVRKLVEEPLLLRGEVAGADIRELALQYGFASSGEEYDSMLHEVSIALARKQLAQSVSEERQIIAAVEAIDDVDEACNILAERLKEWYLLFRETSLKGEELAQCILEKEHEPMMQSMASDLLRLYATRASIEEYLKESMPGIAPNLTNIAGHLLGARLLSIAGSLEKLASMPSSTVQVIGASTALFRHLKGKATSPKHGLIFRHPLVNSAPGKLRGKLARALASKISLAARYDYYSGKINESLLSELEAKVKGIKKRHSGTAWKA